MKTLVILGALVCFSGSSVFAFGGKKLVSVSEDTKLRSLPKGYPLVLMSDLPADLPEVFSDGSTRYFLRDPQIYTRQGRLNLDIPLDIEHCKISDSYSFRGNTTPVIIPAGAVFILRSTSNRSSVTNLNDTVPDGEQYSAVDLEFENPEYPQISYIYCRSESGSVPAFRVRDFNRLLKATIELKY